MRITAHLGVQLSPPRSSLVLAPIHMGVNTANLESEVSESSDTEGGDDSISEGGSASQNEPATAIDTSSSNNLDATEFGLD